MFSFSLWLVFFFFSFFFIFFLLRQFYFPLFIISISSLIFKLFLIINYLQSTGFPLLWSKEFLHFKARKARKCQDESWWRMISFVIIPRHSLSCKCIKLTITENSAKNLVSRIRRTCWYLPEGFKEWEQCVCLCKIFFAFYCTWHFYQLLSLFRPISMSGLTYLHLPSLIN